MTGNRNAGMSKVATACGTGSVPRTQALETRTQALCDSMPTLQLSDWRTLEQLRNSAD